MVDNPIHNPGVSPTQPGRGPTEEKPDLGDEGQPKPFSLPPEPLPGGEGATKAEEAVSPMEAARAAKEEQQGVTPEKLHSTADGLQSKLDNAAHQLQDPSKTQDLSQAHLEALKQVADKGNADMQKIAKETGQKFAPEESSGTSPLLHALKWIGKSQSTMTGALQFLQDNPKMSMGKQMALQFSMQRASQRAELFTNILGASIGGLKTIMSTQLG